MQGILQAVFIATVLVVKSECTDLDCEFGKALLDRASENPIWLDTGDVQGFKHDVVDDSEVTMCFYHHSLDTCGVDISGYHTWSPCYLQCKQHSRENTEFRITKYINTTNELIAIVVNARMLAPSDTFDTAYVLRVWNETVVYFVRGGLCSASDSLDMSRSPVWLLQNPVQNCTPSPSPTTSTTSPSIDPSKQEGTNRSRQSPGVIAAIILGVVVAVILTSLCVLGAGYCVCKVKHQNTQVGQSPAEQQLVVVVANTDEESRAFHTPAPPGSGPISTRSHSSVDSGQGGSSNSTSTNSVQDQN